MKKIVKNNRGISLTYLLFLFFICHYQSGYGQYGSAVFTGAAPVGTPALPFAIAAVDFGNPNGTDVVTVDYSSGDFYILEKQAGGNFNLLPVYSSYLTAISDHNSICAADFDGGGNVDLAVAGTNGFVILSNNGALTFSSTHYPAIPTSTLNASSILTADFDNNTWPDIAYSNGNSVCVFLNFSGTFNSGNTYNGGYPLGGIMDLKSADFDQDGKIDLVVTDNGTPTSQVVVLYNDGTGIFNTNSSTPFTLNGGFLDQMTVASFDNNNNSYPDLVVSITSGAGYEVAYLPNNNLTIGNALNQPSAYYPTGSTRTNDIVSADYDGDGDIDFVCTLAETSVDQIQVFINGGNCSGNGNGSFSYTIQNVSTNGGGLYGLCTAYFDNDLSMDLAGTLLPYGTHSGLTEIILNGPACSSFNSPPVLVLPATYTICKTAAPAYIPFTMTDAQTQSSTVVTTVNVNPSGLFTSVVTYQASNTGTIANGPGPNMLLALTPTGVPGTATIDITVDDGNMLTAQSQVVVTIAATTGVVPVPTITIQANTTTNICDNASVSFSVAATTTAGTQPLYAWAIDGVMQPISNNPNFVFYPPTTGSTAYVISCYLYSSEPCALSPVVSNTITVKVVASPIVTVVPAISDICIGGCTNLNANGASAYAWSPYSGLSATTGASVDACPVISTTYTVIGTDANGCTGSASAIVNVSANPIQSTLPGPDWELAHGGDLSDELNHAEAFQKTFDGGYVMAVKTTSGSGGDLGSLGPVGGGSGSDLWLVKMKPDGYIDWHRRYGGKDEESPKAVKQTMDGGYIVVGSSNSTTDDVHCNHCASLNPDFWILKLDGLGYIQWSKSYGGTEPDEAYDVIETANGDFIVAGYSLSSDGDVITPNAGAEDGWVIKLNSFGDLAWEKSYGGNVADILKAIQFDFATGGYVFAGNSSSTNLINAANNGAEDYWLVSTDAQGNVLNQKTFGGSGEDFLNYMIPTDDGGFLINGSTNSPNLAGVNYHAAEDYWVVKLDGQTNLQWNQCYGGSGLDIGSDLIQTNEGGFLLIGGSVSNDGDVKHGNPGTADYWVVKINENGIIQWQTTVGSATDDVGMTAEQAVDGTFIVAGIITSDISASNTISSYDKDNDVWIYKFKDFGNCDGNLISVPNPLCQGSTVTFTPVISNQGNYTYEWFVQGIPAGNSLTFSYVFTAPGTYTIELVVNDLLGCPKYTCFQEVDVLPGPNASAGSDQTICTGGSATLNASPGGLDYEWSTGATTQSITESPTAQTAYTVTVTDPANGCSASSSATIFVVTLTVDAGQDESICTGSSASLTATPNGSFPGLSYIWSNGNTNSNISVSPSSSPTNYTVTVTVAGCNSASDVVQVTLEPLPVITVTNTIPVSCTGVNDGVVTFTVNSTHFDYVITSSISPISGSVNGTNTATVPGIPQGSGTITVTDQSLPLHCSGNQNFSIGYGGPEIDVCASLLACGTTSGDVEISLTVTRQVPSPIGATFSYTVSQTGGGPIFSSLPTVYPFNPAQPLTKTLTLNANTNYTVVITASDNGCTRTANFTVGVLTYYAQPSGTFSICNAGALVQIPVALVTNDNGCTEIDPPINYIFTINKKVSGQYTQLVYTYNTTTLPIPTGNLPSLGVGEYEVTISLGGMSCTVIPSYFNVVASTPITVTVQTTEPKCHGGFDATAIAQVTSAPPGLIYEWYMADPPYPATPTSIIQPSIGNGFSIPNLTPPGLPAGNYAVVVTDPSSTCTNPEPVFFTIEEPDEMILTCSDGPCSASAEVTGGTPGYTFEWYLEKTLTSTELQVIHDDPQTPYPDPIIPIATTDPMDDPLANYGAAIYDPTVPLDPNVIYYNTITGTYTQYVLVFSQHVETNGIASGTSNYSPAEPGNYQVFVIDANGCRVGPCSLVVEHIVTPRVYEICFNWKTRSTEETPPPDNTQNITLSTLEASNISMAIDNAVHECIVKQQASVTQGLEKLCFNPEFIIDEVALGYNIRQYHYTLYYYDRAGNLTRTVPPGGVMLVAARVPTTHDFVSGYKYNSLAQLVHQETPDGGKTDFLYNNKNQLLFSQNEEQLLNAEYSYKKYDRLGRAIEVGKAAGSFTSLIPDDESSGLSDPRREQTFTIYSDPATNISYHGMMQRYLQNRVSYSYTRDIHGLSDYTYYSYDPHGNVEWMVKDIPGFGKSNVAYDYDLISNKVLKVRFNEGRIDQYFHRYNYDQDNRLLGMETSKDGYIWDKDATYEYYLHGPLRRTELGEDQVQGLDYTYTLQGWLKGINSPHLDITGPNKDFGKYLGGGNYLSDGDPASGFSQDEFGMVLGYYEGDFDRGGSPRTFLNSVQGQTYYLPAATNGDLYNGNISTWVSKNGGTTPSHSGVTTGEQYTYDRLNRIKSSQFNVNNGSWQSNDDYQTTYSYDITNGLGPNGNITGLTRKGDGGNHMDILTYNYYPGSNRLEYVTDAHSSIYNTDIDDQGTGNYVYDKIGNLIKDDQENIEEIKWNVFGKIDEIIPEDLGGSTDQKPYIKFTYDATGNRVAKHVINPPYDAGQTDLNDENDHPENVVSTYYVRDASGNIMAIYERTNEKITGSFGNDYYTAIFKQKEVDLYGSDRVGTYNPSDLEIGRQAFLEGHFYDVSLNFDDFKRETELSHPVTNSHTDDYFISCGGCAPLLVQNAFINDIDFAVPANPEIVHAPSQIQFLGLTDNAVASVEADDVSHTRQFIATGGDYWGTPNTLLVYDKDNYLMAGSTNIPAGVGCDNQSKPVIARNPGSPATNNIYYLFARDAATGFIYRHTVDMSLPGNQITAGNSGEITNSEIQVNAVCGRHMAVVEDNPRSRSYIYYTMHDGMTHVSSLNRVVIALDDVGNATFESEELVASYESYDQYGDGEIQVAPDGSSITIYNHLQQIGWFNHSLAELLTFKLNSEYGVAYATTNQVVNNQVQAVNAPVAKRLPLPDNNLPKGTFDYSADGTAFNIAQTYLQNYATSKIVYTENVSSTTVSSFTLNSASVGDIRHVNTIPAGANPPEYNNYFFAKGENSADNWFAEAYYTHQPATNYVLASVDPNEFLDGALPYQPHRVFTNVIEEFVTARVAGNKEYELKDHLGNVRVTVTDRKEGATLASMSADITGINNYYPFGMLQPGRNSNATDYRYGYQGSEKIDEVSGSGNHYSTHFRELDVRTNHWWTPDPKTSASPWLSPYVSMSNNPIMLVDPLGDKEYKSVRQFERQNKGKTWEKNKGAGDWLRSDRIENSNVWKNANEHNLQHQEGYNEYNSISQRRDFYQWFQTTTEQQGSETKWAGAATIVARQMAQVDDPLNAWVVGKDVVNFANAGNKAIFNDVFGDLRGLYDKGASGSPLKGEAAKLWDANILYKEQFIIVQPIYLKQNVATIMELSRMAKGEGIYGAAFLFQEELKFTGNILNPQDRYNHGMNRVVPYYNKWKFSTPASSIRFPTH